MVDDPRAVLARLPALVLRHPVKLKELRIQWNQGCAQILQEAKLPPEQQIKVVMDWLAKAGVRDFVLGRLIEGFAKPLPPTPTEEQKTERRQKRVIRAVYHDDLPHLRAVNKVVADRLEGVPPGTAGSLAFIDSRDEREKASPGVMFAEFVDSIEKQAVIEYRPTCDSDNPFTDAAE